MKNKIKKLLSDPVLIIAWILAVLSAFIVHPDSRYPGYIDFRSLGILWGLMIIIQGLRENSVFEKIGDVLLSRVKKSWQLAAVLVFLCFVSSMVITNDVALITFVPFALMTLSSCKREDLMIPVIVLQTVAANLGSMLTPIGNPQNLYLYGLTGMRIDEFVLCMLPYTLMAAVLLLVSMIFLPGKSKALDSRKKDYNIVRHFGSTKQIVIYLLLFLVALLSVLRIVPWYLMVIAVLAVVAIMDGKILLRADYILLLTFVGFFIFTGNMGRMDFVKENLTRLMAGREFITSVITSQFISNVPATLMLSGFTENYKELLAGVNVGGLGTLIASMASLISFKAFSNDYKDKRGKYLLTFTAVNLIFLILFIAMHFLFVS
ncbi:SLC13 family permease [Butyrivibrio sp. VCD2006]|uniref:SLC13 family permease n=1 Tax=Butyrivibrio sp. VCD2006 TaxID=1280664 RepID=UPI0004017942|nr:SLC13 family permease [Butyrivibrio sp. VCD2006]